LRPQTRFVASFLGAINWIGGIGVRPEAMRIAKEPRVEGARSRPATVVQSTFLGNCVHIEARLADGQTVVAEISRLTEPFAAGDSVYISWEPDDELTFE
jgi:ABC-type Fe3+/spermidine/putrescine transport system ATPase subunit